jgi:hypothetical protein
MYVVELSVKEASLSFAQIEAYANGNGDEVHHLLLEFAARVSISLIALAILYSKYHI